VNNYAKRNGKKTGTTGYRAASHRQEEECLRVWHDAKDRMETINAERKQAWTLTLTHLAYAVVPVLLRGIAQFTKGTGRRYTVLR